MTNQTAIDEESDRISVEVSNLSTQLLNAIERESLLEERLLTYKRELDVTKKRNSTLVPLEEKYHDLNTTYEQLSSENASLKDRIELLTSMRQKSDDECNNLRREVEDLSESLFGEANKMVSDARRETYNFKIKNEKLYEELNEKDIIISTLQTQLVDLKGILQKFEDEEKLNSSNLKSQPSSMPSTPMNNQSMESLSATQPQTTANSTNLELTKRLQNQVLSSYVYSPMLRAIRYDLQNFGEFKSFIVWVKNRYVTLDPASLRESAFFKKILVEDIDPAIKLNSGGIFKKNPLLLNIIDNRVTIEPISGINETYRLNHSKTSDSLNSHLYSYPKDSPPVATHDVCGICDESRDDVLEHSRLYMLKVTIPAGVSNSFTKTRTAYPLCNACLFKVRAVCEIFNKLRLIKKNIIKIETENDYRKIYCMFAAIRCKLFWSRLGIWDLTDNVTEINFDSFDSSIFEEAVIAKDVQKVNGVGVIDVSAIGADDTLKAKDISSDEFEEANEELDIKKEDEDDLTIANGTESAESEGVSSNPILVSSVSPTPDQSPTKGESLQRNTSRKFKENMNNELNKTMEMLEQSMDEFNLEKDN